MKEKSLKASCNGLIPDSVPLPPGRLLLAFSGGDDSLSLLSVLSRKARGRCMALYVNHSIRSDDELEMEEIRNRANAAALSVPYDTIRLERGSVAELARRKGIGIEAAARELRYKALHSYRSEHGFDWILTAHHRDDQAETVAMRMLSSAPFYAWSGIRRTDGVIFRPFLGFSKADILSYLENEGLTPSVDSTNSDLSYLRNSIRHALMPLLSDDAKESMAHIAENVAVLRSRYSLTPLHSGFYISYDRQEFIASPRFACESAVYDANAAFGGDRISRRMIEDVMKKAGEGRGRLETSGMVIMFTAGEIRFYPSLSSFAMPFALGSSIPCGLCMIRDAAPDALTLRIDQSILVPPVIARDAREGDVIELKGGRKRISELMKDQRVPYSIVLEDRYGIVCCFSRAFGGRDRLSKRFLGKEGEPVALALI